MNFCIFVTFLFFVSAITFAIKYPNILIGVFIISMAFMSSNPTLKHDYQAWMVRHLDSSENAN